MDSSQKPQATVSAAVAAYARRKQHGPSVIDAWHLHRAGGLSAAECARRLEIHPETVRGWFRDLRALVDQEQGDRGDSLPIGMASLQADDIGRERARVLEEAKLLGGAAGLKLQQQVLADEGRRLGTDVTRTESISVEVQFQAMPPAARRAELVDRLTRLADRGALPRELEHLRVGEPVEQQRDPGPPPQTPDTNHHIGTSNPSAKFSEQVTDVTEGEELDGC